MGVLRTFAVSSPKRFFRRVNSFPSFILFLWTEQICQSFFVIDRMVTHILSPPGSLIIPTLPIIIKALPAIVKSGLFPSAAAIHDKNPGF